MLKRIKIFDLFHPVAIGIIFGTFLSRAGFFMSLPFLGIYLLEVRGIHPATIGIILGVSYFVSTFSSFFGGAWSDRIGRFPVMILSMFVWCGVFIGFSVAREIWQFFVLNALNGLCRSIFEPTARALLADVTPEERRIDAYNARYFAINIGGAIGPLVGLLVGASKNTIPFLISGIIYAFYGLLILWWTKKYPEARRNVANNEKISLKKCTKIILRDKVFSCFLMGNIFVTGGYAHLDTTLSQYLGSNHVTIYSMLFITNTISILILQYPLVRLMKKYNPLTSLKIGSIFFSLGLFGFGISHSIILLVFSMILFTAGEILCFIIGDVFISEIAPEKLRGAYYGAAGLQFIGQSSGAWLGGVLLELLGFKNGLEVFGILAICTVIAYPFFQLGHSLFERKNQSNEKIISEYERVN